MPEKPLKPGWKPWRFEQMAEIVNDRIDNPADAQVDYYVGLEHLDPESLKIRRWGSPSDVEATKLQFKKGDIIFGRRRVYQRKLAVADFDGICSAHAMVLRARPAVVRPKFLPFFMQSDLFMERAKSISVGSLSPTINWKTLAKQEFALPPLEEHLSTAKVLQASECAKQTSKEVCLAHENAMKSFLDNALQSHAAGNEKLRVPELLARLTVGIVVKPADLYVPVGSGVPALRSLNILPGRLNLSDLVYISTEGNRSHQKSALSPGDVAVVRSGRPGDAAVIPEGIGPLNCIDLVVATPNERMNCHYLAYFLNSNAGRRQFAAGTAGTAQKHFNVGAFKRIRIPCPPIPCQLELVEEMNEFIAGLSRASQRSTQTAELNRKLINSLSR